VRHEGRGTPRAAAKGVFDARKRTRCDEASRHEEVRDEAREVDKNEAHRRVNVRVQGTRAPSSVLEDREQAPEVREGPLIIAGSEEVNGLGWVSGEVHAVAQQQTPLLERGAPVQHTATVNGWGQWCGAPSTENASPKQSTSKQVGRTSRPAAGSCRVIHWK
jgi:U3 small nucleolar RNA-associated protein 14